MEKQRWEESERRSQELRRAEKRKNEKKENAGARKDRKVALHYVFPMICGSGWSKSRLAKAAGAEPSGRMRDKKYKKCKPLWRKAYFEANMYKTRQLRSTFRSCDVEKVRAVVARSTFSSQNVQTTPTSDHFWKLSACCCGAKHIFKSKCTKHTIPGPLLEVLMWTKCTPLWREAHFQVKMYKAHHVQRSFES